MKKVVLLTLICVCIMSMTVQAQSREGAKMAGITAIPSFSGPGLGYRSWETPQWGWALQAMPSWQFDDVFATARLMKTLSTSGNARWYGLLAAGYAKISDETEGMEFDVSMPTVALGVGWEKLFGIRKNKGFSLEAGYQYGKADYEIKYDYNFSGYSFSGTIKDTYEVPPIYIGASLAFYF